MFDGKEYKPLPDDEMKEAKRKKMDEEEEKGCPSAHHWVFFDPDGDGFYISEEDA